MRKGGVGMLLAIKALAVFSVIYVALRYGAEWLLLPLAAVIFAYYLLVPFTFVCPDCKGEFKQDRHRNFTSVHILGMRYTTCPHCGRRGFFQRKAKEDRPEK